MNPKNAWREIVDAFAVWKFVLFIDARRLLSIAWNGVLTIPVPYLGLVKLLDYALCVPVFLFEGLQGKENLKRSETLMLGHRMRLLRAGLGLGTVLSLAVGVVVGTFSVIVPSLPSLLMEPATSAAATATAAGVSGTVSSGMDTNRASETAMGIFTGTAFDRVWDVGTITEKWATVFLLAFAVVGSFLFAAAVRQLVYVFYRETAARYAPPPPPEEVVDGGEPGPVKKFLAKMAFWKKVEDGDTSDAVATRTAELREKESSGGDKDFAKEKGS
jgi:large-conductance mechanosensitive channel|tara:strand:+ start:1580 stop:2398 length:819 start_codon:yes stop_codon:yes gene_type:complete